MYTRKVILVIKSEDKTLNDFYVLLKNKLKGAFTVNAFSPTQVGGEDIIVFEEIK